MEERARFPDVAAGAGHYESFYVKACRPGGGQGVWIRHTVHKRPGAEATGSLWFVLFDRAAEGPRATKVTLPTAALFAPAGDWIRVGNSQIGPRRAEGGVATEDLSASWQIGFSGDEPPCRYLPADWLYRAPVPRTKFIAPNPNALLDGRLEVDGEAVDLSGWRGMIGHNWGSEHAERWIWLEGTGFGEDEGAYFDAGAARVAVAGRTTPWIPSGMLALDGERHRLGGLGQIRSSSVDESPTRCSFTLTGRDIAVRGTVEAPQKDFVGWVYADPKGPEHNTVNCSVADLELTVERPARPARTLRLPGGAAYELGMRETDHGIPVQPYPDG
jgi:hypothetical protein